MSAVAEVPLQPSLRRMRRFGVHPDRDLGQNFLIDSNILGVIDRAAALDREDVVLRIDRKRVDAIAVEVVELEHRGRRLDFERKLEALLRGAVDGPHPDFIVRLVGGSVVGEARGMTNPQQHQPVFNILIRYSAFKY